MTWREACPSPASSESTPTGDRRPRAPGPRALRPALPPSLPRNNSEESALRSLCTQRTRATVSDGPAFGAGPVFTPASPRLRPQAVVRSRCPLRRHASTDSAGAVARATRLVFRPCRSRLHQTPSAQRWKYPGRARRSGTGHHESTRQPARSPARPFTDLTRPGHTTGLERAGRATKRIGCTTQHRQQLESLVV